MTVERRESDRPRVRELTGQLAWISFFARRSVAVIFLLLSVTVPWLSIQAGPGKSLIADVFGLLVGTASLLHLVIWLAVLVTRFHFQGELLTFRRLGRRSRSVEICDVIMVQEETGSYAGANVWLRDGTTLVFSYAELPNARELVTLLRRVRPTDAGLEGCLNRSQVARTIVSQWLVSCLLLAIAVVGGMCLAVFLQPKNLLANPLVFLLLGLALLSLAGAGFYAIVVHYWLGTMRWFQWDGTHLRYRTLLSGKLHERYIDEIVAVSARRPCSQEGELGTWRVIHWRDGERLKLPVGTLHHATQLYAELKAAVERRASGSSAEALPPVTPRHPLWPLIAPHLAEGETVLWLGQPVYGKLWSEMLAEMVFGWIPGGMGIGALFIVYQVGVRQGQLEVWPLLLFGLLLTLLGGWMSAAPWRYRRLLRDTVYVVTTQRVVIIHGLLWGSQAAVQRSDSAIESLSPEQVRLFEVIHGGRDIVLGGQWRRGRKGTQSWLHAGFLAADDPAGAELAIRTLLRKTNEP
ncbi:MAG: hypothetical protein U0935_09785 [Pirellulales bacterium]